MDSLEHVKDKLYSLLIAHNNAIKIRQLLKEYNNSSSLSLSISCVKFGFANEIDLIRDEQRIGITITDHNLSFLDYIVYAIPDKQTKHNHSLVDDENKDDHNHTQKRTKTLNPNIHAYRQRFRSLSKLRPYSMDSKQQNDMELEDVSNRMDELSIGSAVCPRTNNCVIPESELNKISALMSEYYKGINLINFLVVYQYKFKEKLDVYRFGYNNLEEFLSDMPDIVELIYSSPNDINVMPVTKQTDR